MTIVLNQAQLDELLAAAQQQDETVCQQIDFELQTNSPRQFGTGWERTIKLRNGLTLEIVNLELKQTIQLERQHKSDFPLVSKFCLSSHFRVLTPGIADGSAQPASTGDEWLRQIAQASVAQITAVQLNPTSTGVEVILETAGQLEPTTSVVGDALIVDISNAVLTADEEFQAANPTEGIALVTATNLPNNRVRVAITGTTAPPTASVRASEGASVLSVTASAAETANDEEEEIEIIVTGKQEDDNYFVPDATTATRTDTPLRDIPQSIQVIPEQVLEDQQVIRLDEALNNVSGVTFVGTTGNVTLNFNIRRFNNAPVLQVGFRQFGGIIKIISNTTNRERIEVLKGSAAILYGQIEPGGVINLVTEQPLAEPFYEAELEVGNRELFRPPDRLFWSFNRGWALALSPQCVVPA